MSDDPQRDLKIILRILPSLSTVLCLVSLLVTSVQAENLGEWPSYGADKASSKYLNVVRTSSQRLCQPRTMRLTRHQTSARACRNSSL
jgi:hypothetical protein